MNITIETIEPTFPPSSPEDDDVTGARAEDLIYLIACFVVFVFAVFGTMFFDKKQQTEQKMQRIRLIMRSLVIQSVGKDGPPVGKPNKSELVSTSSSSSSTTTASMDGTTADEQDGNNEQQPCDDVENQVVGEVEGNQTTKKPFTLAARWKQRRVTSKVAVASRRNTQSSNENNGEQDSSTTTSEEEDEDDLCPICIMPFQAGEKVCWSKNPDCDHAFHTECVKPWLMDHSECPCCRKDYLTFSETERENEERRVREEKALRDVEYALSI